MHDEFWKGWRGGHGDVAMKLSFYSHSGQGRARVTSTGAKRPEQDGAVGSSGDGDHVQARCSGASFPEKGGLGKARLGRVSVCACACVEVVRER